MKKKISKKINFPIIIYLMSNILLKEKMAKKKTFLGSLIVVGVIVVALFLYFYFPTTSTAEIKEKVKNLYELANPGSTAEIISINEESGVYKVVVKISTAAGTTYREAYVTKDGKMLTESMIFVEQSIERINAFKNFTDCLRMSGVRIYGITNDTATLLQLNLLGRYSTQLFVPCDGNLVSYCINANVSKIPSVVINGKVYPGVKDISWFEQNTNCRFSE